MGLLASCQLSLWFVLAGSFVMSTGAPALRRLAESTLPELTLVTWMAPPDGDPRPTKGMAFHSTSMTT